MEVSHVDEENLKNNSNENVKGKSTILENFSKLTLNSIKIRKKAGAELIKHLSKCEEDEKEIKYALGRLIRGLGSSSNVTRCGYFSTLVPLLNVSNISVDAIFDSINKELHKGKSNSKSENADISMGHILVCGAIVRSKLFMKSSVKDQNKVIQCLIDAGKERSYLLYASFHVLLNLVESLSEEDFSELVLPILKQDLVKPWSEYNLDNLYILIKLRNKHPKIIGKEILKGIHGSSELVTAKNVKDLASILLNIPKIVAINHPVYQLFGEVIIKTDFTLQFIKHMDEYLEKYNVNKHIVIINLLSFIIKNVDNLDNIPHLLEKNFIQQTLTIFRQLKPSEKDNLIKQSTHKLFDIILIALNKNVQEKTKIAVIKKLLFYPGTFFFEKVTKSKLVQQITGILKSEGVKKLAKLYKSVLLLENEKFNAESSNNFQNNDRLYAAHLFVKLISHPAMHEENDWKYEQLKLIMHLGLVKQQNIGLELAGSLKETFYHSLDLKISKLDDLSNVLYKIFHDLDTLLSENNSGTLRSTVDPETHEIWSKARDLIDKIQNKKKTKVKLVFQILFLHLSFQLLNDVKLAKDSLEELFSCYERVKKEKRSENTNDPEWIEVIVELFLSLLSHNSLLLRKVINCVFPHLCIFLNGTAIHQILSVLDPKNEDNPLTNKSEMFDDEDSEDSADDEENNDEESGDESNEESDENDEDEEEDLTESNTDKLRTALHTALMQNIEDTGEQSDIDLDQLDDDHGAKLNKVLGDVFKQFRPNLKKSKKQNKNDETLTHFRSRVLDLIEIYLVSNPSMILTLEIMLPLLQLLEFSIKDDHQKPLQERTKSCMKKLTSIKKFADTSEVNDKIICDILGSLLEKGTKNAVMIQLISEEISQCCIFLVKCSQNLLNSEETPNKIKKHLKKDIPVIIKNALEVFLSKRDCPIPFAVFKHILQINWIGNVDLTDYLITILFNDDIRPYRRNQAVELLKLFYSNHRLLNRSEEELQEKIMEMSTRFLENCLEFFTNLIKNPSSSIKEKFISVSFTLIVIIKNSPIKLKDYDWKEFGETIKKCSSCINFSHETKRSFKKFCTTLKISNDIKMGKNVIKLGNKIDEDEDNLSISSNNENKKKNKQKSSKDKLKLKKQAKEERLKSLSKGLEIGFSNMDNINGMDFDENIPTVNGHNTNGNVNSNSSKKRKISDDSVVKKKKNKVK